MRTAAMLYRGAGMAAREVAVEKAAMRRLFWLVGMLIVGCAGADGTPAPRPTPTAATTTAPTPVSTAVVSPVPSATAEPVISPVTSPDASPDPARIVLRMHHTGGHLYPGMALDAAPAFTLYGDGSVIYRPSTVPLFGPELPAGGLRRATMDGAQVANLIEFALDEGGLADADERYDEVPVADSLTTNFTIDAGGVTKRVSVYGLGDEMEPTSETPHRERFKVLAERLGSFEDEIDAGNAVDAGVFEPQAYRVTIIADEFREIAPSGDWPWPHLTPDDFARDQSGFGIRILAPDEAALLFNVPVAEIGDRVVVGPDEVNYLIRTRALLPDEIVESGG